MTSLPIYDRGSDVVIEERWRGVLWTAVPHRVIDSTPDLLIGWVPAGTRSVYATNRGLPQTAGLTRDQRKLLALQDLNVRACEFFETPGKLSIYRPDRWSRINLGFDVDDGHFLGWYVDFQLPVEPTTTGPVTKDLVLDLWIIPDRVGQWKDRDDLDDETRQILASCIATSSRSPTSSPLSDQIRIGRCRSSPVPTAGTVTPGAFRRAGEPGPGWPEDRSHRDPRHTPLGPHHACPRL